MQPNNFTITGNIIDSQTGQSIPGLRIEAWDKDLFFDDLVGSAETDAEGLFKIRFNEEHFKELFERHPDLYFRLYSADDAIPGESFELIVTMPSGKSLTGSGDSIYWNLAPGQTHVSISLSMPVASHLFRVEGTLLQANGTPVAGMTVKAFDRNLRIETLLGEDSTNQAGRYQISYRADNFLRSGKQRPDLIVRAFDSQAEEIASTREPIYNARPVEKVDLIVGNEEYKGPTEYQQLMNALSPLLKDLELSELTDEDVKFLAGKTGIAFEQIIHLVLAVRFATQTELPPQVFYGLFRQNFPTSLPSLIAQNPDTLKTALETAVKNNIVPETIPPEQVLERFQELVVDHAFEPLEPLPNGKTTLGELIGTVQITQQQQRDFINRYVGHQGTIEEFWQDLEETEFQPSVQELQYTLQLGVLTGNYLPLIEHLKQLDSICGLRDLAGLEFDDWKDMVETYGFPSDVPGMNGEEQANNYAQTIVRMIEDAFPTAVISYKVEQDSEFPGNQEDLVKFFNNSPDFEFGATQIDRYLQQNTSALVGIQDEDGLIRQLKTMDRLFHVSPRFERYEAIKVLMENGFNSAQSIAMMGQRNFCARYAENLGNYRKAKSIYTHAAQMTAMTLTLHARYSHAFNQPGMTVLSDTARKMQEIPDWETLFGSFKLCDCEHCKSVLSPSAYLVDLLAFLRNHNLVKHESGPYNEINSALGVLSDRRHDIEHINLSCTNANTLVPYVDLVNEILENAIPPYYQQYHQTTGTADELSANPEYLKVEAYNKLAQSIYPWSLPFDLWTEESRIYLNHLGVSRYKLMETFRKNGENPIASNLALASEYLGLTIKEQEITTDTEPSEPWSYWGLNELETIPDPAEPDNTLQVNWIELLSRTPVFLEKSGLSYQELDKLLDTLFINPTRFEPESNQSEVAVIFEDAFCNVEGSTITNLDAETLNKVHRFVRLWRNLGWTAIELDIALSVLISPHPGRPEIDEAFLLKLWYFHRLQSGLKIPAINLLGFWSVINTENYKGQRQSLYDQLFLNKAVLNPEDEIFILNEQRNELENSDENISAHAEAVQAALGIGDSDLVKILEELGESESPGLLNLGNLSQIYRIVTFSRSLKLSISEFLSAKKLFGLDPFLNPFDSEHLKATIRFTEKAQKVRNSDFTISELEYLLRHRYRESEGIAPLHDEIAQVLGNIRDGLQKIANETSIAADPAGELTAANLAWLQWNDSHIQSVIDTLLNSRDFTVGLTALPDGSFEFPSEFANRIFYDADNKKLHFYGMMGEGEKETLLGLSGHKKYQKAIKNLFEDAKLFIAERMKAYQLPPFSTPLDNFPPAVNFPETLKDRIYFDKNVRKLFFIGWMTDAEKDALLIKFEEACENFNAAIESLFNAPRNYVPEKENRFLSEKNILELTKTSHIKDRFEIILEILLPYIRNVQSRHFVVQQIADTFRLETKIVELTLTRYVVLPADYVSGRKAIEILLSPDFAQSNPNIDLTPSVIPEQFNTCILLHKIALIITRLRARIEDLPLLFQRNPDVWDQRGWADLNFLPLNSMEDPSGLFRSAEKLFDLFKFSDILLPGEPTLYEILNMAFNPGDNSLEAFLSALSERTGWKLEDIQQLSYWFGYDLDDFQHTEALERFIPCFKIIKRLAVSVEKVCEWVNVEDGLGELFETARSIKQTVKAKYDHERWLEVAKPLRDDLRDRQRTALLSYLIAYYAFRDKTFEDSNELYAHFLIDPEMAPCMMTSRMKLATSSVQLFIQRCLMNLEEWKIPSASIAQEWGEQWQWMKNYRVWEANRKVFLYPENWIEPELRDDKSPFFRDLENELLQNETTEEHVEKVFLNYLEKLDAVARLEVCGMYHEVEKEAPDGIGKNAIDTLHVFGRTRGIPHIYYYRRRIASGGKTLNWTPWERVDLDIEGDHLIPVNWNRRLYLFWPIFTEKANEDQDLPDPGQKGRKPEKYWEIQMAWSEYRNKNWSPKTVSNESIDFSIVMPAIYDFFSPFIITKNRTFFKTYMNKADLTIVCYVVNPFWSGRDAFVIASLNITGCFDRIIINYHAYQDDDGTSYHPRNDIYSPLVSKVEFMTFEEIPGEHFYALTTSDLDSLILLYQTPGTFNIVYPHQHSQFAADNSFFYQDDKRTFFVAPRGTDISDQPDIHDPNSPDLEWHNPGEVQLEDIDRHFPDYYEFIPQYEHWEEMLPPDIDIDPPVIETTFPAGAYDESIGQIPDYGFYSQSAEAEAGRLTKNQTSSHMTGNTSMVMANASLATEVAKKTYLFERFYHPYVCEFVKYLNRDGIDGLLQRPVQLLNCLEFFEDAYKPAEVVDKPYPYEDVDFKSDGPYSLYNWEIFFHAPLMVADRLSRNQRFADAQKWFHYIFDPTDTSTHDIPRKYWKFRPFFEAAGEESPETLEDLLTKEIDELEKQVNEWRDNPFKPHLIARIRIMAYQKTVVMKYIDNLMAWGDQLFRRDTIESVNEATQLYILAAEILGKRPENIQPHSEPAVKTFNDLEDEELDAFSNTMVDVENHLLSAKSPSLMTRAVDMQMFGPSLYLCCSVAHDGQEDNDLLYFCIPRNQILLSYWDTVADRLFKIRHCMNIEGVVRQLPLFEPPIDPALLVRAVAAGVDIGSALNDLNAPLPHYRFQHMLQKAIELCADVRSLGASLLSALEKKDAEELALLRLGHEVQLLKAIKQIKKQQIDEAKESLDGLKKAKEVTEVRYQFYSSREYMNPNEQLYLDKLEQAHDWQMDAQRSEVAAAIAHILPTLDIGSAGWASSPLVKLGAGGLNIGSSLQATAGVMRALASIDNYEASRASIRGGYDRRSDDWNFQTESAAKELKQIDKQILAAEIRMAIAEKDLKNHSMQIENAEEASSFMKDKFSNQELYSWMVSQISTLYFQSYQMAYDIAKRVEKTFRHELGDFEANFVNFGYWDSLKKGLLSGEQLHYDLKRMETAYLEKNKREFELTRHVSMAMLDPLALVKFKETGQCFVNLPEALFDLDYPGHYMRRIKSVSLTIPCVTGPYTSVNCTLTLLNNSVRISSTANEIGDYPRIENDLRFRDNIGTIQSIATSSGQNDSGVFELNFRDERYLPFEGAGVISNWRLEMPKKFEKFDYSTISDVIIHLRYTCRDGGGKLKTIVEDGLQEQLNEMILSSSGTGLYKGFNIKRDFSNQWHRLKQNSITTFTMNEQHLPQFVQQHSPCIAGVIWLARVKDNPDSIEMLLNESSFSLDQDPALNNLNVGTSDLIDLGEEFTLSTANAEDLEELVLLFKYTLGS